MVKYGQTKDPQKRQEKYDTVKADYDARLAKEAGELEAHRCEWASEAALSPLTGRVLAIGLQRDDRIVIVGEDGVGEAEILARFWDLYKKYHINNGRLVGFDCFRFDLPFLIRRSWWHGTPIPDSILKDGRYWSPVFLDLVKVWGCGAYNEYVSLDTLAKFFGVGGKPEGVDGGMFAGLWNGAPEDRQRAIEYLANDLKMTWNLAEKMGVIA